MPARILSASVLRLTGQQFKGLTRLRRGMR